MPTAKRPARLSERLRSTSDISASLGQSERVAKAFGRCLGFVIMMTAIVARTGTLVVLAMGIGRLI